ncbi:MAG: hypothetical protein EXQ74_01045 [Thermoleophilia bacterium]|nr:hypothetical protein [Thermoleophilia bacterium]
MLVAVPAGLLPGCGGGVEPTSTAEIAPGTTVSAARYLELVREAVAAARAAAIRLDALPDSPSVADLTTAASGLAAAATRAETVARQLSASRLEDQRLEDQRHEIGPLYAALAVSLRAIATSARAGDVTRTRSAVTSAAAVAERIHTASAPQDTSS